MPDSYLTVVAENEDVETRPGYLATYIARIMSRYQSPQVRPGNRPYTTMNSEDGALVLNSRDPEYRPMRGECFKCGRTGVSPSHVSLCSGLTGGDESEAGCSYDAGPEWEVQPIPCDREREIGYIVGPSGSGKTVFLVSYVIEYMSMFEDRNVFIFTGVDAKDPAYEPIMRDPIMGARITFAAIDSSILDKDLKPDEFKECLVVFDDTSAIMDKKIKEKVDNFMVRLCDVGRHHRTTVVVTNHLECEFSSKFLKKVVTESHFVATFPTHNSETGLNRLLTTWCGLSKKDIARIKDLGQNSRWVYLRKSGIRYLLSSRGGYII